MMIPEHPHLPVLPVWALEPPLSSPPQKNKMKKKKKRRKKALFVLSIYHWNMGKLQETSPYQSLKENESFPIHTPVRTHQLQRATLQHVYNNSKSSHWQLFV